MFTIRRKGEKRSQAGQALILVLVLLALGSVIVTSLLGFIAVGAKTGTVYDKKAAELYAADAGIQDAIWQIRNQQITTTCPSYNRYDFNSTGWSYDIPPVNNENVHVQLWNMWMIPSGIKAAPAITDVPSPQTIATGGQLIVTGNTVMPALTANDGVTTIYEYDINISYNPGAADLRINDIGIWFPPGYSLLPDETGHTCSLTGLTGNYANTMTKVSLAGSNCWYWAFNPANAQFINFPPAWRSGTAPSAVTITIKLYFQPPQDQSTLKPDAVAWITTSGNSSVPYAWDATTTIIKTTARAYKGSDTGTTIDSYMAHSELPQMQTAQAGDYVATGTTLMLGIDPTSNQRELLLNDNSNTVSTVPTNANANVELAYLYWTGWLKQPATGANPAVGVFWDNGNNLNNWTISSPSSWIK